MAWDKMLRMWVVAVVINSSEKSEVLGDGFMGFSFDSTYSLI